MANATCETLIAERFARWFSETTGRSYTIRRGPDPPDFLMEPGTWLEVSDIFLTDGQAKFLNLDTEQKFSVSGSPDDEASSPEQTALRLLKKLDEKLAKTSYRRIYEQRGRGILLLTCKDFFFDEVNLARVESALASFNPKNDQGFFRLAYFEYCVPAHERVYKKVYQRKPAQRGLTAGVIIAVAIAIGAVVGAAMHDIAMEVAFGAAFGVAAGPFFSFTKGRVIEDCLLP